ncbi:unnamed protein product, partial [Ectocarpus sp. 12 AP-2014]
LCAPAIADVRELARSELRENVRLGNSMSLSRLIKVMEAKTDGKLVNVRAFEVDEIYYHVVLKKPDGKLTVAVVNARSGKFMSRNSSVVKEVISATKDNSASNGNGNSGNNGNGNSGNNGNGNSGNNGNGNSGNNGNGNSGNNGNSGGNSGGGNGGGGSKK